MSRRVLTVVSAGIGVSILAFYLGKIFTDNSSEVQKTGEDQQPTEKCAAEECCGGLCETDLKPRGKKEDLRGTVKEYAIQLFVVDDIQAHNWPRDVGQLEEGESAETTIEIIKDELKKVKKSAKVKVVAYTLDTQTFGCINNFPCDLAPGSVIIFPHGVLIPPNEVKPRQLVQQLSLGQTLDASSAISTAGHSFITVCCHLNRDTRCGYYGPIVLAKLYKIVKEEFENLSIFACSHVGGHVHAPNIICWPTGDYYGLCENSLETIINDQFIEGIVNRKHWRGRMGLSKKAVKALMASHGNIKVPQNVVYL